MDPSLICFVVFCMILLTNQPKNNHTQIKHTLLYGGYV